MKNFNVKIVNEAIDLFFEWVSSLIGNIASNIAPLLAGILPAFMTYYHVINVLHYPPWVAWCAAGLTEFLGLGAGQELMEVWAHNRKYKDEKAKMPWLNSGAAAVWYILIIVVFNVILEAAPNSMFWKITAQALFATLAIAGYALFSAKTLRKEWKKERSESIRERREERTRARGEHSERKEQNDPALLNKTERPEHASKYAELIESILERKWQATGKVPGGAEIVRALNEEHSANLDRAKASGYIATLTKNWKTSKNIKDEASNGRH
jgi:hypothetical protein